MSKPRRTIHAPRSAEPVSTAHDRIHDTAAPAAPPPIVEDEGLPPVSSTSPAPTRTSKSKS